MTKLKHSWAAFGDELTKRLLAPGLFKFPHAVDDAFHEKSTSKSKKFNIYFPTPPALLGLLFIFLIHFFKKRGKTYHELIMTRDGWR